jgi:hypothetical protein
LSNLLFSIGNLCLALFFFTTMIDTVESKEKKISLSNDAFLLTNSLHEESSPFDYDLHIFAVPGKGSKTMICFHGYGGDYRIAQILKQQSKIEEHLISFNFPDYGIREGHFDPAETTFGTINELLPAIYVLKKCIIENGIDEVVLYGFSAGGGALVNVLAVLNTSTFDHDLKKIGVSEYDKQKILDVIQKGHIIFDTPLKSIDEIIAYAGPRIELEIVAERYRKNNLIPIDSLELLDNLSLNALLHFQIPDEILSNRDDALFIERLKKCNATGTTSVVIGRDGGHGLPHPSLWSFYSQWKCMH